ncbi:dUTPase [Massilia atriviolacea]|uniref:dUTPase n=1 Tax=Massilia atriviolacea TaxID=2495579 RepID=A0A430HL18_9BURK|nr:dUTP diphosphatase [Massilia atriviolacea]RSZ58215.1 dUTPase [Massilia atriviolacea]
MKPLQLEQARQLLALQSQMNSIVNTDWLNAGYPFLRAVVVEVGEALDHLGWKWWKKESSDLQQVVVELIDILHFMLSHELVAAKGDLERAAEHLVSMSHPSCDAVEFDGSRWMLSRNDPRNLFELLAGLAVCRRNELPVLEACFDAFEMTWDQILVQYVSKNVLNIFRQDHGYKTGTYIKEWSGQEDNIHLVDIVATLDVASANFSTELYNALSMRYRQR